MTRRVRQRGVVTAELAVGLIVVAIVATVACFTVSLVISQGRCEAAAAQIAREVARGDKSGERTARKAVPEGGTVAVSTRQGWVTVTVTQRRAWGRLGPLTLTGRATVPLEPGEQP